MNCPYCGKEAEYIDSKYYYANGVSYGMIYLCRQCDAVVSTHKNSGKPLGSMANRELRELRKQAHSLFDPLWKDRTMTRTEAYDLLRKETGVKHISWTNAEECRRVINWLSKND